MDALDFSLGKSLAVAGRVPRALTALIYALFVLYVSVFVLWDERAFREVDQPRGAAVVNAVVPPAGAFNASDAPYCAQFYAARGLPVQTAGPVLTCHHGDSVDVSLGRAVAAADLVTRVTVAFERRRCADAAPVCPAGVWAMDSHSSFYYAALEDVTLRVQQFVTSRLLPANGVMDYEMVGRLLGRDGRVLQRFSAGEETIVAVSTLLEAAGVTLDVETGTDGHAPGTTLRYAGTVLALTIEYSNVDQELPSFAVRAQAVVREEVKTMAVEAQNATHRWRVDRHLLHVSVTQTGQVGRFSWPALVLSVIGSLGIAAGARFAAALFVRRRYGLAGRVSEVFDVDAPPDAARTRPTPAFGDHELYSPML